MITQIKIEKCDKPYCVIHAEAESEGIKAIAEKIGRMDESGRTTMLTGWDRDYCIQVKQNEIFRIYSMDKKVYLETEKENLLLKLRLYEFEELAEKCGWTDFIRISNTDIVNFSKVTKLDMSLTGIVRVNFTNGKAAIVSRRYMNKIKSELLNLKHR
ncbi:MAG: LytTR family transcriptional regulator [Spirochaetaceae bacterium]|nr:LytTR family transcriptional regulator [Spirochaetaceae bacterium]